MRMMLAILVSLGCASAAAAQTAPDRYGPVRSSVRTASAADTLVYGSRMLSWSSKAAPTADLQPAPAAQAAPVQAPAPRADVAPAYAPAPAREAAAPPRPASLYDTPAAPAPTAAMAQPTPAAPPVRMAAASPTAAPGGALQSASTRWPASTA